MKIAGYEIIEQLQETERSKVFKGADTAKKNTFLIKTSLSGGLQEASEMAILNEFEITSRFNGKMKPLDLQKSEEGIVLIRNFIDGITLHEWRNKEDRTIDELLQVCIRICNELEQLHVNQLIHKEINPNNIIVCHPEETVFIIDYGLSSILEIKCNYLGNPSRLEGTPEYISPEQTGRMNRMVDYRCDLYSLGVTMYELFTNQLPFNKQSPYELIYSHIAKQPLHPSLVNQELPEMIGNIIMKLLSKNAEDRYQTATRLKKDLEKCLQLWNQHAHIEAFNIETGDVSLQFKIPQKLYGREGESKLLLDAFEQCADGKKQVVLVGGYTGIGKTALIYDTHIPIMRKKGFFTDGKFEQLQRDIPYLAWTQAFNKFIDLVLTEEKPVIEQWKKLLLQEMGVMASVVTSLIPQLEKIIGPQEDPPEIPANEVQNRFNYALRLFIKAICTKEHPLVIFIDDFQWTDAASLNLLRTILTEPGLGYLLIIGAYRDNEVNESHPFVSGLADIEKEWLKINETDTSLAFASDNILIKRIFLDNLNEESIAHLLSDTLSLSTSEAAPLATLIEQKTHGNAFFVHRFLESLYEDGHIKLLNDHNNTRWQFQIETLQKLNITDNVVDLLTKKTEKLNSLTRQILYKAACIGHQFDLETLGHISNQSSETLFSALNEGIKEGFIIPVLPDFRIISETVDTGANKFRFSHDRVKQTVYSFIDVNEKKEIHQQLGMLMIAQMDKKGTQDNIFEIANHLNEAGDKVKELDLKSKINYQAGVRAKASSANAPSYHFFIEAIQVLPPTTWKDNYEYTLKLYNQTAEAAYLSGNYAEMERLLDIILQNASTKLDKVLALEIRTNSLFVRQRFTESINSGLEALQMLGMKLPPHPTTFNVVIELLKTRWFLRNYDANDLLQLPLMTDEHQKAVIRILANMAPPVFFSEPNLFPIIIFKMTETSVRFGIGPASSYAFSVYGFVLCGIIGDVEKGVSFGKLAMELLQKNNFKEYKARTLFSVHFFIDHWKNHSNKSLPQLKDAYRQSLESGEADFTAFLGNAYSQTAILNAQNLEEISKELNNQYIYADQTKHFTSATFSKIYHQYVQCLQNKSEQPALLKGPLYHAAAMHEELVATKNKSTLFNQNYYQSQLSLLFGDFNTGIQATEIALENIQAAVSIAVAKHFHFIDFLIRYHRIQLVPEEKQKHWKKIQNDIKGLKKFHGHCPEEFEVKLKITTACLAALDGNLTQALTAFNEAEAMTRMNPNDYDRGLLLLEYYRFCHAQQLDDLADIYLQKTIAWYSNKGAIAVAEQLAVPLKSPITNSAAASTANLNTRKVETSRLPGGGDIDFYSIVKGSQVISSELGLHQLNSKMLEIMVENAGAERGVLFIERQKKFYAETEYLKDGTIQNLESVPLEEYQHACLPVINYVLNTTSNVVLDNASASGRFVNDNYIIKHQVKSLLCIPIQHMDKVTGLIYLENNIADGAFTQNRTEVLKILGAQAAISIENAKYYNDIQLLNQSYERFVPKSFLAELEKKSIVDIELGNQVVKNMGVLFSDIRNFTTISERLSAAESFALLNEIWGVLTPVIDQNHGIVDKYIGDAIMALFPSGADDALKAGEELQQKLNEFNIEREKNGKFPIHIGVGLNCGPLVLGTVGSSNRLNTTVIGDTVNITSRLESLTKTLKTGIIVTAQLVDQLKFVHHFKLRNIGDFDLKGKSQVLTIYEDYANNSANLQALKQQHLPLFDEIMEKLKEGDIQQTRPLLVKYCNLVPDDTIAAYYFKKLQIDLPDDSAE
jgi:predicted ATPase/class 3 adenylate cyclase/predicted Ser/Thr protein kinase